METIKELKHQLSYSKKIQLPSNIVKDTLIKVRQNEKSSWEYRYFYKFDVGTNEEIVGVICYPDGENSRHGEYAPEEFITWNYAVLIEPHDVIMMSTQNEESRKEN